MRIIIPTLQYFIINISAFILILFLQRNKKPRLSKVQKNSPGIGLLFTEFPKSPAFQKLKKVRLAGKGLIITEFLILFDKTEDSIQ